MVGRTDPRAPSAPFHTPGSGPANTHNDAVYSPACECWRANSEDRELPRFVAIPVGQGDAFFLDRGNGESVLVDGGRATSGFAKQFKSEFSRRHVSVVVCTHNDADHANGVLGFLEDADLSCDEVWLPYTWSQVLAELPQTVIAVLDELVRNVGEREYQEHWEAVEMRLNEYGDGLSLQLAERRNDELGEDVPLDADLQAELALRGEPTSVLGMLVQRAPGFLEHVVHELGAGLHATQVRAICMAVSAASKIADIAIAAAAKHIPIKWFKYDVLTQYGGNAYLAPVNARRVNAITASGLSLFDLLALTTANRESLVFWSPRTTTFPGVLFTADSDLSGQTMPAGMHHHSLCTAPHHGSESNAVAYAVVEGSVARPEALTWVRSQGRISGHPGPTYLGLGGRRFCTICRLGVMGWTANEPVKFYSRSTHWVRMAPNTKCVCW